MTATTTTKRVTGSRVNWWAAARGLYGGPDDLGALVQGFYPASGTGFTDMLDDSNAKELNCTLVAVVLDALAAGVSVGSHLGRVWRAAVARKRVPRESLTAATARAIRGLRRCFQPDDVWLAGLDERQYQRQAERVVWRAVRWLAGVERTEWGG